MALAIRNMISTLPTLGQRIICVFSATVLHTSSAIIVLDCEASPSPPQMSHYASALTYATTFSSPMVTLSLLYDAMLVNS